MSVAGNLRDKRALILRLIVAEALAKPGEGPLAPRFPATLRQRMRPRSSLHEAAADDDKPAP